MMASYILLLALIAGASSSALAQATGTLQFNPDYSILVAGEEYKIDCDISGNPDSSKPILRIELDKFAKEIKVSDTEAKLEGSSNAFSIPEGSFKLSMTSENSVAKRNLSLIVIPNKAGSLKVECANANKEIPVVIASRAPAGAKDVLFVELSISNSQLPAGANVAVVRLVTPTVAAADAFNEPTRNCSGEAAADHTQFCFRAQPKGTLAAGIYRFELRVPESKTVITSVSQVVSSPTIEIKECASLTGSNCIADSDTCHFKCKVIGHPFSNCAAAPMEGQKVEQSRLNVECVMNEQMIKVTILKPIQEDSGKFNISARGGSDNGVAHGELQMRVKDKLAPLWPFLGICAEVVILCGIILFFEKRHQKKLLQQENDAGDASEPLTKSSGKGDGVRQRPAKA